MTIEDLLAGRSVVVVAAHPDDESGSAGGLLQRLRDPVIVHATDGSPRNLGDARAAGYERREDYMLARRQELLNALEIAGIGAERTRALDFVDQESSFHMREAAERIAAILKDIRPGAVLTHPYEGGHPDHDAAALAVHLACASLPSPPEIFEFTSYHAARPEEAAIELGLFLPGQDPGEVVVLPAGRRETKRRMLDCFVTQKRMLEQFPVDEERYRPAPAYDFTEAPHPGRLFYENFDWGITGGEWRRLAGEALRSAGIKATL